MVNGYEYVDAMGYINKSKIFREPHLLTARGDDGNPLDFGVPCCQTHPCQYQELESLRPRLHVEPKMLMTFSEFGDYRMLDDVVHYGTNSSGSSAIFPIQNGQHYK